MVGVMNNRSAAIAGVVALFGVLVATTTLYVLLSAYRANHPYIIGDWEINYAAGFVRRGLLGEVVRGTSGALSIEPRTVVLVLQLVAYAAFLVFGLLLVFPIVIQWPAFASRIQSSYVLVYGGEPGGSRAQKEILLLAALSIQACTLNRWARSPTLQLVVLSAIDVVLVLSHEVLVLFMPFQFLLMRWCSAKATPWSWLTLAATPIVLALFATVFFHGDHEQVAAICDSLKQAAPERCVDFSAISWLGVSGPSAMKSSYYTMVQPPFIELTTAQGLLLGAVPFALLTMNGMMRTLLREKLCERGGWALLVMCLTLPIAGFAVGTDHGRWLFTWLSAAMLLVAAGARSRDVQTEAPASLSPVPAVRGSGLARVLGLIFLLMYSLTWNMPGVCCPDAVGAGALGQLLRAIHF